jgi:type IV pilus assembly protein PilC
MPLYGYQVMDRTGALATGKLEAENETAVFARLKKMGLTPLEVSEAKTAKMLFSLKKKVGLGDLSLFSRQLGAMLNAGIPLTRCLFALGEQTVNPTLSKALQDIGRNVESGASFSESMRFHNDVFNDMYVDLIKAGEVGGTLEEVLHRLSQQLDSEKALKDSVKSAMFYPAVVFIFAFLVTAGMLVFIVPVFIGFYPEGAQLPFLTGIIVAISNSVRTYWYIYVVGMSAMFFGLKTYLGSPAGKRNWDKIIFKIPVFGTLSQKTVVARFARTLSTLLSGGIPILQALETAGPASGNMLVTDAVTRAGEKIQEGHGIALPLRESGLFPAMVILMISVGEETGDLPALLTRVSEFYEMEVATMAKGLTSLIEPLMLIFVGGIVGFMVIALYLPIFSVITQI